MGRDATEKLTREAAQAGLSITGPGRAAAYRMYRFASCGHSQEFATSAVRQLRFRCQSCLEATRAREATSNGLELVGPGERPGYRRYRFQACGHEIEAQVTHARGGNVRCRVCTQDKHITEATAVGVELLGPGSDAHTRSYRFTVCGHTQEAHVTAVRDSRVQCRRCIEDRFEREALATGLVLLGPGAASRYRRYRFAACGHEVEYTPSTVRDGVRCMQCIDERLIAEGINERLTLIGPGRNANYRLYRFGCGHERELTTGAVKRGHIRCQVCYINRLSDEAASEGLSIIGAASKATDRLYRFQACGHERELSPAAVRLGHVRCKVCLDREIAETAARAGLEVIGPGRDANYRMYRFIACGHQREIAPGAVRRGTAFCRDCFETSLANQARLAGVEIVGPGSDANYRLYRFLICGHEQQMQAIHVRLEGFHCQTCNDSAWRGQGNVYVVALYRGAETLYKVGLAKSVRGRITRYGLKEDVEIDILHTQPYSDYRVAHAKEQLLHAALRLAGLGVSHSDAREFLTSGFTECYSTVPDHLRDKALAP